MELKPVVHHNNGLSFEASEELTNAIASLQGQLVRVIFIVWCFAVVGSIRLFYVEGKFNFPVILFGLAIVIVSAWGTHYQVNKIRSVVLKIASRVSITDEVVCVEPFTFGVFFWKKRSPDYLQFKISELKIRKTDNPIRFKTAFNNRVFEIKDKNKEAYIVFDFFDKTLKETLMNILVDVTPAELLLPGRLRHY